MKKKILVILEATEKELRSVHYALSLAERLEASVDIVQQINRTKPGSLNAIWVREAIKDLIHSAREAGLFVSHHLSGGELKEDIRHVVKGEPIDILVFGNSSSSGGQIMQQIKPLRVNQIIRVRGKNQINYM